MKDTDTTSRLDALATGLLGASDFAGLAAELRKALGWSYRHLAARSGVPLSTVHMTLNGERGVSLPTAQKLAGAFAEGVREHQPGG